MGIGFAAKPISGHVGVIVVWENNARDWATSAFTNNGIFKNVNVGSRHPLEQRWVSVWLNIIVGIHKRDKLASRKS